MGDGVALASGSVTVEADGALAVEVARNLAIDALRLRCGVPTVPAGALRPDLLSTRPEAGHASPTSDAIGRLKAALNHLPAEQRRAVLLAAIYGRTAIEIANSEQIPVATAKSRIRAGMATLRESLVVEEQS